MTGRLLILGASARAAAMSARRAGFECWAADRFLDLDLQGCCPAVQVTNYPAGFAEHLASAPPGSWLYTGALENHPALIAWLAAIRPLAGIGASSLRRVRDPFQLAAALQSGGFSMPQCARSGEGLPRDGTWLSKRFASAGGVGVMPWTESAVLRAKRAAHATHYFQRRVEGIPVGAVYVAQGGRARLLGVTRQLSGARWCGLDGTAAKMFRYCGSVGPIGFRR